MPALHRTKKRRKNLQVRPNVRIFANNTGKQVTTKGYTEHEEQIARFAKAMGHPARMAILHFLASQQSCFFGEIHEVLPIAKATVSQHLKELKEAGLIQGEIEAPKVRYCINRSNWLLARDLFAEFFREGHTDGRPHDSCCG
jgi:ArsR family transcriptional regulator|nr:metalloregulator ArsR/SmtB family transcription factor [Alistipes sp. CAG:268]